MLVDRNQPCPLPEDPLLAEVARSVQESRDWAWIVDDQWRLVYTTDEHRESFAAGVEMVEVLLGEFLWGPAVIELSANWATGLNRPEMWGPMVEAVGGLAANDREGGLDGLRNDVHPDLVSILDRVEPCEATSLVFRSTGSYLGKDFRVGAKVFRIRDSSGLLRGTMFLFQPAIGMGVVGPMSFALDPGHLERMAMVARASRTPAALLFADLEGSSALSRTLSSASFFAVGRRIVRLTDQCVVDAGGLVGRHVGDGIVSYFPSLLYDSEADAARAAVRTARAVQAGLCQVEERSGLDPGTLVMRFGVHWGATVHIGNVTTAGRFEVVGQGDEANEAARIEACATGGRILASKQLVERLDAQAASEFGFDPDRVTYTQLSDLPTATAKARRDAPAIAVCEL